MKKILVLSMLVAALVVTKALGEGAKPADAPPSGAEHSYGVSQFARLLALKSDCNGNQIDDAEDYSNGILHDANDDGFADECDSPQMVPYEKLSWSDLPERPGMRFAILSGDPKTGPYTQIRQVPAGTNNGMHRHSSMLKNVIIRGVWYTGVDSASAEDFGPGSVIVMPPDWEHVSGCRPGSDCVFYQEGYGRFDFRPTEAPGGGKH